MWKVKFFGYFSLNTEAKTYQIMLINFLIFLEKKRIEQNVPRFASGCKITKQKKKRNGRTLLYIKALNGVERFLTLEMAEVF
jgi:hypothetical protein